MKRERISNILTALNAVLLVLLLSISCKILTLESSTHSIDAIEKTESTIVRTATGEEITFHNGGWSSRGSCWCSNDNYCMCTPSLAIDLVILDGKNDDRVWVVRRRDTNQMALMGGFSQVGESTDETVIRELKEETGIEIPTSALTLLGVYGDPKRDKRRHTVSAVYIARIHAGNGVFPQAGDDVKDVFKLDLNVLETFVDDDFFADHLTILKDYKKRISRETQSLRSFNDVSRSICPLTI